MGIVRQIVVYWILYEITLSGSYTRLHEVKAKLDHRFHVHSFLPFFCEAIAKRKGLWPWSTKASAVTNQRFTNKHPVCR